MQRINISEKINLGYIPKNKFKTNFFKVSFAIDLDRKHTTNLSLLSAVLVRATKNYPTIADITNRLDYLYDMNISSSVYRRGERLILDYDCDFIRPEFVPAEGENLLDEALDMFEEILLRPYVKDGCFDEKILDSEKTELENSIKSLINYKRAYAKERCIGTLCEGERYAVNVQGELCDIPLVTGKSLYEFYKEFLSVANIEIMFVGEADEKKLAEKFAAIFAKIQNRRPITLCQTYITDKTKSEVAEICEPMKISQGNLALGFRTGVSINDKDAVAMALFCDIYGASPTSKLFMNVREKMSLCYYCSSTIDSYKGILLVLSGIQSENKEKAQAAILKELSDIQKGLVTEEDLAAAKLSLVNSYKALDDNVSALSSWYISRSLVGIYNDPCDVIEKINSIGLDEIIEVSKKAKLDTVYFIKGEMKEGALQ